MTNDQLTRAKAAIETLKRQMTVAERDTVRLLLLELTATQTLINKEYLPYPKASEPRFKNGF